MRIQKVQGNSYAKIPDKLESEIVKTINKYLTSIINNGTAVIPDKNTLVQEIILRMYPVTAKLAGDISKREIEKAIENLLDTLDLSGIIEGTSLEYITFHKVIDTSDSKRFIDLPLGQSVDIRNGEVYVKVNGMEQLLTVNYSYILDTLAPTKLSSIDFGEDVFEDGDMISIQWCRTGKDRFARISI